jgi:threonine dehydrogenase-like Zn-dependent dehydrogenase
MKLTGGRGVDVAIEVVGHPPGLKLVGEVIKNNRAKIIAVGWHQSPDVYELFNWIKSPIIYSPQGIGMSTDYQSELQRAMWALKKGSSHEQLVTHRYKGRHRPVLRGQFKADAGLYQGRGHAGAVKKFAGG